MACEKEAQLIREKKNSLYMQKAVDVSVDNAEYIFYIRVI